MPTQCTENLDLGHALYQLASVVVHRMPRDISLTSASVLHTLERLGPQRLTRLAALQGVTQPSMTALVSRLEEEGLAERRQDSGDGRVVLVALTAAGDRFVATRREVGATIVADLLAHLPKDQSDSLVTCVPAILALCALDQDHETGSALRTVDGQ